MTPLNSINGFPISNYRFQNKPVIPASSPTRDPLTNGVEPASQHPAPAVSIHQLPEGLVREITDIVRRIGTRAYQAAEPGQTVENREVLQAKIAEELSTLETVSSDLSQEDLKLFAALFQNQVLFSPGYSDTGQDSFIPN
ncbi:hypothetical protein [Desulfobacula sp.]|uniref:hypothetical protein n=1 Tax=Desulfobacula sp. TaxID=2593537 RepID=UPI0026148521|nr:hypothetical protein [Desulfobacula sp.]